MIGQVVAADGVTVYAVVAIGPYLATVRVNKDSWGPAPSRTVVYESADCTGQGYIPNDGGTSVLDQAVVAGTPGNQVVYVASHLATTTTIAPMSSRDYTTNTCQAGVGSSLSVAPIAQSIAVSSFGPAPYSLVRTP
ncbi:MAG: hypothetical protein R2708_04465 [Vicinamibacterales bacterium]